MRLSTTGKEAGWAVATTATAANIEEGRGQSCNMEEKMVAQKEDPQYCAED